MKKMIRKMCPLLALTLMIGLVPGCGEQKNNPAPVEEVISEGEIEMEGEQDTPDSGDAEKAKDVSQADASADAATLNVDEMKDKGFMLAEQSIFTTDSVDLKYQFAKKVGKVTWVSANPKVVKVGKNGSKLTGKSAGETDVVGYDESGTPTYISHVTVEKKPKSVIYLTFDDGPTRYSTPKVLDILKDNDVKATFFEIKPAKEDYDLTQRILDEGHTLAIHGYSHTYKDIYKSEEAYKKNLTKLQKLFYKEFGVWSTLTRFPGGSSNTISRHYSTGIMTRLSKLVPKWGFKYFDWNVSSGDAGGSNNAAQVYKAVTKGCQKGRGNVVLMHDFSGNDKTINALDRIIKWGKDNGFVFRALNASNNEVHHGVNN
ncbi:MAG: polysaccharide deacetylase [Eubacterium sp.]|nr:polysaccharide deacetylase [Eubacterium sp.]